ncbi:hypothetical protein KR018_005804 [Drosophila ironensis]|nr:hypothetical protein KR018_005804 [Drosophila ironensis]
MEIILPQEVHDAQKFLDCAEKLAYDEFSAKMFVFCNGNCDVDVFELMGDDRLMQLIYGWEVCRLEKRGNLNEEGLRHMVHVLAHHSLLMWFSQEWRTCSEGLRQMLLFCLSNALPAFSQMEELAKINWSYLLKFRTRPWGVPYLQRLFQSLRQNKHQGIEHPVSAATSEDVAFLREDGLDLILLRLIQLFNAGNFEAVKQLSLRMLAAWLSDNIHTPFESLVQDTKSITLVGHLYLLTVFVNDENRGYMIDNLMYNIRFYALSMQEVGVNGDINLTPARLIAQVCVRLQLSKSGFFEQIGYKTFKLSLVTSFAVMLDAYTSYVLGNQLVELTSLNEHDFLESLPQFKELMYRYVEERENSERFLLEELKKMEQQRNSHYDPHVVKLDLNYQQQICKGNRASNIGDYKNCDDDEKPAVETDEEQDRQIDPVFQNVPNNEEVLTFVYDLLSERTFTGWKFAKIALLLKIIGQQLNAIEIWRYHPGLTTEFMLNLEEKMSENFADLARLFSEHGFMEAEFWLTAFYLNPINQNYNEVKRCSRIKKKRQEEDQWTPTTTSTTIKYELLSSTIDVDEIVTVTNHNAAVADYDPIYKALQGLRMPRSIIKDLLTVTFQPRNKRYSWALDWQTLHERCSALLKSKDLKNKFVALNMAEASDRLEYLKIDYAKYKNRPQLDYGTIEEGYENAANLVEPELQPEKKETVVEGQEEAKSTPQKKRRPPRRKFWDEVYSEEEDEEEVVSSDSEAAYTSGGRRTRIRAAAIVANAMLSDMDRTIRSGRRSSSPDSLPEVKPEPTTESQVVAEPVPSPPQTSEEVNIKKELKKEMTISDLMEARTKFSNETNGFKSFADIWSFEKEELQNVASEGNTLMECSSVLNKFKNLRALKASALARKPPAPTSPLPMQLKMEMLDESQAELQRFHSDSETESASSKSSTMAMHDFTGEEDEAANCHGDPANSSTDLSNANKDTSEEAPIELTEELTEKLLDELTQDETEEVLNAATQKMKQDEAKEETHCQPEQVNKEKVSDETSQEQEPKVTPSVIPPGNIIEQVTEKLAEQLSENIPKTLSGKTKDLIEEQTVETTTNTDTETDTAEESLLHDEANQGPSLKRLKLQSSNDVGVSKDSRAETAEEERQRMIQECLQGRMVVRLPLLTTADIDKLRGLRIRIKRTNLETFYSGTVTGKRRRTPPNRYSEESTASTLSSEHSRKRVKEFIHITSDSPGEFGSPQPASKLVCSDSSTDLEEVPRSKAAARKRGRSGASRSKAARKSARSQDPASHVIELSSDSSSNSQEQAVSRQRIQFTNAMEMDPLYEEEIVPF